MKVVKFENASNTIYSPLKMFLIDHNFFSLKTNFDLKKIDPNLKAHNLKILNIALSFEPIPSISPPGTPMPREDAAIKDDPVLDPLRKSDDPSRELAIEPINPDSYVEFNEKFPKPTELMR